MFAFDLLITFLGYDNIISYHSSVLGQVALYSLIIIHVEKKTDSTLKIFSAFKYIFFFTFILSLLVMSICLRH